MYNSKYYFEETVSEHFSKLEEAVFVALVIFIPLSLGIYFISGHFLISLIPAITILFYPMTSTISEVFVMKEYNQSRRKYREEQLVDSFHKSPNYHFFVQKKIGKSGFFISTMLNVKISLDNIESKANENNEVAKFVRKYTYFEESKTIHRYILMNPKLLKHYLVWAESYIVELEKLTSHYARLTRTDLPYTSDMGIEETIEKALEIKEDIEDVIKQENEIKVILCINEFLDDFNYTLVSRKANTSYHSD